MRQFTVASGDSLRRMHGRVGGTVSMAGVLSGFVTSLFFSGANMDPFQAEYGPLSICLPSVGIWPSSRLSTAGMRTTLKC